MASISARTDPGGDQLRVAPASGPMDALAAIATRSSAIRLAEPGPNDEQLMTILEAGARAPDHGRLTPWRFVVIEGRARARFGQALAASCGRQNPAYDDRRLALEAEKPLRAPLIIAVAARITDHEKVPAMEQILAAAAAAQNMLLAAHAQSFGSMWKTGAAASDPVIRKFLGFRDSDVIVGFLYLGTADKLPPPRQVDVAPLVKWL